MNIHIRAANSSDTEVVAAHNAAMAQETEHLELDRIRLVPGVRAVLEDPHKGFYTVAEVDGRVAGQMLVTYEWSDWRNGNFWWIQSVYVRPEFRGQGVFRRLYEHVRQRAEADSGVCGLRLYVEAENRGAQGTYRQLGMQETPYRVFEVDFVIRRAG